MHSLKNVSHEVFRRTFGATGTECMPEGFKLVHAFVFGPDSEEAMRQAGVEIPSDGKLWRDLPPEQWSVSQRVRMAKKKEFENLVESGGYRVCVDMAFHELMPEKARASLIQQVRAGGLWCSHGKSLPQPRELSFCPKWKM